MSRKESRVWPRAKAARRAVLLACVLILGSSPWAHAEESGAQVLARARDVYMKEGPRPALEIFEQALQRFREEEDRSGEAITLGWIGNCHKRFGDYPKALQLLGKALGMKRDLADGLEEGKTLSHLGLVYWEMGDYPRAIEHFRSAGQIARKVDDQRLEGSALNNLSLVYDELGEYGKSLAGYERVLELYARVGFPRGRSDTLANTGGVYLLLGQYRRAIDYYRQALEIDRSLDLVPGMSSALGNIALCHLGLGEIESAVDAFDRALELAREAGLRLDEAYWLRGKANALLHQGRYDLALELHRRALAMHEEAGSRGEVVEALSEQGDLFLRLGDLARAEDQFQRALAVAEEIGLDRGVTLSLLLLGDLEWHRQRYERSAELYARALGRAEMVGDRAREGAALVRIAAVDRRKARFDDGLEHARRALTVARQEGMTLLEARALLGLGRLELGGGSPERALELLAQGEAIAVPVGEPDLLWRLRFARAETLTAMGRKTEAVDALRGAIEVIESVRGRLREERFRAGYLEDKYEVYVELVRLLLDLGRIEEAFSTSETMRSRTFLALLDRTPRPIFLDPERRLTENDLRRRIRRLQGALDEEHGRTRSEQRQSAIQVFSAELAAAEREYQDLLDDLRSQAPGSPAGRGAAAATSHEVRSRLAPGRALVEYVVSRQSVLLFVLTGDALRATTVEVSRSDLEAKVELLRELLKRTESEAWRKPAQSLGEILVAPMERRGWLEGVEELYLIPHHILNYLPFAALLRSHAGEERYLIEDYEVAYLPSGALLSRARAAWRSGAPLLALAPERVRLRYAEEEARSVARLFPTAPRVLTGDLATEGSFKRLAPNYRTLHLATHSVFNKRSPLLSGLHLEPSAGEDGTLEVHEILGLRLDADLVTLSACDTALASGYFAEVPAGDEFVGLTRAFLLAGSSSVLSSLWEVDDRSTLELMVGFYRNLAVQDKAEALALVQRRLGGSEGRYRHPYYWASFVLHGAMGSVGEPGKPPNTHVKGM